MYKFFIEHKYLLLFKEYLKQQTLKNKIKNIKTCSNS